MRRRTAPLLVSLVTALWMGGLAASQAPTVLFRDIRAEAGITYAHRSAPEKKFIHESMSGGMALFDYDDDGRVDMYFVDALTVETAHDPKSARSVLYRNLGGNRFEDVTDAAGVAHPGWGMGACTADVDGDGWEDLYVTNLGPNALYRNNGNGTFKEVAAEAGVAGGGWSMGCGFADYDRDGDVDLFVSRYVKLDLEHLPEFGKGGPGMKGSGRGADCQYRGVAVQCGPRGLPGEGDLFFRNRGDGRFEEVSAQVGVDDPHRYFGLGIAWLDADEDGWLDLFVSNDAGPNFLYVNQKDSTFKDSAFPAGVAVSEDGAEQGCMGVAVADYENAGRFSLFVTNFAEEYNAFYRNAGSYFTDWSFRTKTAPSSLPFVGWGVGFLDYDNDGWQDIIVGNGHVYPQLDQAKLGASAPYRQRRLLYHNRGDGTFEEGAEQYGTPLTEPRVSRGVTLGDLDNDGRMDVVVADLDGHPLVLRNELAVAGNWLLVKLRGKPKNTSAVGAVVTLRAGGLTMKRLVRSGTGYISQDDKRLHFGLGAAATADWVEVLWPDQTKTRRENVKANEVLLIRQE